MTNDLKLYHQILFLKLKPWGGAAVSDAKYKELLQSINKEHPAFQPLYEVDFPKPLSAKRKYYHALILNEATSYLNKFHKLLAGPSTASEKKYWVHTTLTKVISQKLKETAHVISEHQYTFEQIQVKGGTTKTADESYSIHFLKCQLIRIYLEIQNSYTEFLKEDAVEENDLLQIFFEEPALVKSFLIDAPKIKLPIPASQVTQKTIIEPLKLLKNDFRKAKKGILTYDVIVKAADSFSSFEEELFTHGFIDNDYNFPDKHGQKQVFAAIYHAVIKKGYFNKKNFDKNTNIKPLDIRKFLDHRYNAETDKQFRTWANDPDGLANLQDSHYWIYHLPTC